MPHASTNIWTISGIRMYTLLRVGSRNLSDPSNFITFNHPTTPYLLRSTFDVPSQFKFHSSAHRNENTSFRNWKNCARFIIFCITPGSVYSSSGNKKATVYRIIVGEILEQIARESFRRLTIDSNYWFSCLVVATRCCCSVFSVCLFSFIYDCNKLRVY